METLTELTGKATTGTTPLGASGLRGGFIHDFIHRLSQEVIEGGGDGF